MPKRILNVVMSRHVRWTGIALFAIGFALLVGAYMKIVNRYVHSAVQAYVSGSAVPDSTFVVALRLGRPDRSGQIDGTTSVTVFSEDSTQIWQGHGQIENARLTTFEFRLPPDFVGGRVDFEVNTEDGEQHSGSLPLVVTPPADLSQWLLRLRSAPRNRPDPPRIQLVRVTDGDGESLSRESQPDMWRVDLVADGGEPVRFLPGKFLALVTSASGTPIPNQEISFEMPSGLDEPQTTTLETDSFGLAEFEAELVDWGLWTAELTNPDGTLRTTFEVVPGFALSTQTPSPLLEPDRPASVRVHSNRTQEGLFSATVGPQGVFTHRIHPTDGSLIHQPPQGGWPTSAETPLMLIQVAPGPVFTSGQGATRCLLVSPSEARSEAWNTLLSSLEGAGVRRDYVAALRQGPNEISTTSEGQQGRLLNYLCAKIHPSLTGLRLAFDNSESQRSALEVKTIAFRKKAHWMLGLGTIVLLLMVVGRVAWSMWRTKQLTEAEMAEIDDPELALIGGFGANVGFIGIVWIVVLCLTIAVFCVGVISMLANM